MPVDTEILGHAHPEPPTELELQWKDQIAADEYSIYVTKLELVCEEAKQNLVDVGLSPAIQGLDCAVGLYTAQGDLAVASVGTYHHVCTGIIPIKYVLKHYANDPTVGIHDGDVFFCNEVLYGGYHNADQLNMVPIFFEGELIAWAVSASHELEVGGSSPGGQVPTARTRYDEGIKFAPVKVGSNFELRGDVMDAIGNMVREEVQILGDMRARAASCFKIRERVLEIVREKGEGFLVGLLRKVLDAVTAASKRRVSMLNDGVYRHVCFFDYRGNMEALGGVHVSLVKKGDTITIDLSGSSPATNSFVNTKPHIIRGLLLGTIMQYMFADFPASTGLIAPFRIEVPDNTIVNAPDDHAFGGSMRISAIVVNSIMVCLAKMMFDSEVRERVATPPGVAGQGVMTSGGVDQYGATYSYLDTECPNGAGGTATSVHDGMDAGQMWFSGLGDCMDVEHMEVQVPWMCLYRGIMMDQGGPGKFRGGSQLSACRILRNAKAPSRIVLQTCTTRVPHSVGLMGGYAAGLNPFLLVRGFDWQEVFEKVSSGIPSSYHELASGDLVPITATVWSPEDPFENGDATTTASGASGGYGDALEREPEKVMKDVRTRTISKWAARKVYCVVFDETTLKLDQAGTAQLRKRERRKRLKRGLPHDAFEKEWSAKQVKQEILRCYGPWPMGIERDVERKG